MGKTKTKSRSVGDSPKPPITIRSTNVKILDDNIAKLEKAIQAGDVSANPSGTAEETLLSTIGIDGKKYELGPSAENTSYDNTDSGLTATDTQAAIDEVNTNLGNLTDYQIVTAEKAYTIAASSTINFNPTVEFANDIPEGYTVVGIVGFLTNSPQVFPVNVRWNDNSWGVGLRNISTGEQTNTFSVDILCIKTRS